MVQVSVNFFSVLWEIEEEVLGKVKFFCWLVRLKFWKFKVMKWQVQRIEDIRDMQEKFLEIGIWVW